MPALTLAQLRKIPCKNCRQTIDYHFPADQKCYFEASSFEPELNWENYFEYQKLAILQAFALPLEMLEGRTGTAHSAFVYVADTDHKS